MPNAKKEQLVQEIADKVAKATIMILTDYRGLSVEQLQKLRAQLRVHNIEYTVTKNSLTKIATTKAGLGQLDLQELFAGPTAIAFAYADEVSPAKVLKTFSQEQELLKIKGAIYHNSLLSKEQVLELALLPSRETILTQVVSMFRSPLYGLATAASAKQRDLLYALMSIAKQKKA